MERRTEEEEMERRREEAEDRRRAEEEEYRRKQNMWEEYKWRREEAREIMRQEEDYRMQEFGHRFRQEEEDYLQKEYQWSMYQTLPEWDVFDGNSYEQNTNGRTGDYDRRRQEAEETWRQEADYRWRNGEDADYLRREICWKDYEWRRREALERMKQEEDDRKQEFISIWTNEEEDYLQKEHQWVTYQILPEWNEDDHGNSYEQDTGGRSADYESMMVVSSNHRGSESSRSERDELVGKLVTVLLRDSMLAAWNYGCKKFSDYWRR